ncbi:MAG: branched-chain amino acid ABC transporter permease [Candidatus Atribacteria bacterium]|nr:branched-chain amino acid ABC transporter permease [Candidatus Atribacteria bacterium]
MGNVLSKHRKIFQVFSLWGDQLTKSTVRRRILELIFLIVIFLIFIPFLGTHRATDFAIFCIMVLSFDLLYGYMGRLSMGHLLYLGVGAYATGLSLRYLTANPLLAIVFGILAACIAGMAAGSIAIRATGACFALINLAFNRVGWFLVMSPLKAITGGENGLSVRNLSFSIFNFRNPAFRFWFLFISLIFVFFFLRVITSSSVGVILRSLKEDEKRVRFLGYNTYYYKWINFVISASVAGFAGALTALNYGYINPNVLDVNANSGVIFACLIGGPGSLYGSIIGGIIYMLITNLLPIYFQRWELLLGVSLLLIVFRFRKGLWGGLENLYKRIAAHENPNPYLEKGVSK